MHYLTLMKFVNAQTKLDESSLTFTAVVGVVAMAGFLFQVQNGMSAPFPLNVIFFPIRVADSFLAYFVGTADLHSMPAGGAAVAQ